MMESSCAFWMNCWIDYLITIVTSTDIQVYTGGTNMKRPYNYTMHTQLRAKVALKYQESHRWPYTHSM